MAERIAKLAAETDPQRQPFLNERRAEHYLQRFNEAKTLPEQLGLRVPYAWELILWGKTAPAVEMLVEMRKRLSQPDIRIDPNAMKEIRRMIAIGYFRLGEQENCIANHSIDSCLLPIRGSGVHVLPNGSRSAIAELTALLADDPEDLQSRWLLNLAYMTLGEYPDKVPAEQVISPATFESEYAIPRFYDVAGQAGLAKVGLAGGCITEDFNADGYVDVMSSSWSLLDPIRYFESNADGSFTDKTEAAGLTGVTGGLNICQADYNNDGYMDVLILRGAWLRDQGRQPNSLLRNNGDGTFEDVTEQSGLLSFHPTQAGSWGDYNNDGWIDIFIGNESAPDDRHPCELYRNNGDGTFTEIAHQVGVDKVGFVKGVVWGDYNNDGRPDLYLSLLGQANVLYRNDGPQGSNGETSWRFTDVAVAAGVTRPIASFPTWFWDYNNDGWLDIFVASYPSTMKTGRVGAVVREYLGLPHDGETARLYRNNRDGTFTDASEEARMDRLILAMGSNFGDLDNDGWPDAYLGTGDPDFGTLIPNRMFRNAGGKRFQDVTTAGGFGHLQKGHGVAFVDLDNDGDQDVYAVMGGAYAGDIFRSSLFENPGFGNHWITLRLEGVRTNRAAIGARIRVTVETPSGPRDLHAVVSSGGSFGSSSVQQELGLGDANAIQSIEVIWPTSGRRQVFTSMGMDQILRVRESDETTSPVVLKSFDLSPEEPDKAAPAFPAAKASRLTASMR